MAQNVKPTVLFILHLPPPVHGAAMVGKYIHDSRIVNDKFRCHYINLTTARTLQDIGKGGLGKLWRFAGLLARIIYKVREVRPQLVYVTPNAAGGAFYKDFIVVQLLKAMGCKVVVHYHNKGVRTRQDRWLDDRLYRRFFRGLKVILLAEALYDDIKKYVKREDVLVCPNGIPDFEPLTENGGTVSGERQESETSDVSNEPVPHLLFLSNLIESKGVLVLLDALKSLKERGCQLVCDFVGGETAEMDAARFADEIAKRGLQGVALYHGRKYGDEKETFWQRADLFVFPTFYPNECFPLVLLEAMQHGVACISTREGGITGIIEEGENGLPVPQRDSEALAQAIEMLLRDKERRTVMGQKGRERFEHQFTLPVFERQFATLLQTCLPQ